MTLTRLSIVAAVLLAFTLSGCTAAKRQKAPVLSFKVFGEWTPLSHVYDTYGNLRITDRSLQWEGDSPVGYQIIKHLDDAIIIKLNKPVKKIDPSLVYLKLHKGTAENEIQLSFHDNLESAMDEKWTFYRSEKANIWGVYIFLKELDSPK